VDRDERFPTGWWGVVGFGLDFSEGLESREREGVDNREIYI